MDNGPGWAGVQLASAAEVLALNPDDTLMAELNLGVVGAYPEGSPEQFELRCFALPRGVREDPVTGSLNAGMAQWLIGTGAAPSSYVASQGAALGRRGKITVDSHGDEVRPTPYLAVERGRSVSIRRLRTYPVKESADAGLLFGPCRSS